MFKNETNCKNVFFAKPIAKTIVSLYVVTEVVQYVSVYSLIN